MTLQEIIILKDEPGWDTFFESVRGAIIVKCADIIDTESAPSAERLEFAYAGLAPAFKAGQIVAFVVGKHNNLSTAQVLGASDSAIQSAVNAAIDKLYP